MKLKDLFKKKKDNKEKVYINYNKIRDIKNYNDRVNALVSIWKKKEVKK